MVTGWSCPLMCSLTRRASGPSVLSACRAFFVSRARALADSMTVVAAVTPAPFRNPRRENLVLGASAIGAAFQMVDEPESGKSHNCGTSSICLLYIQPQAACHSSERYIRTKRTANTRIWKRMRSAAVGCPNQQRKESSFSTLASIRSHRFAVSHLASMNCD